MAGAGPSKTRGRATVEEIHVGRDVASSWQIGRRPPVSCESASIRLGPAVVVVPLEDGPVADQPVHNFEIGPIKWSPLITPPESDSPPLARAPLRPSFFFPVNAGFRGEYSLPPSTGSAISKADAFCTICVRSSASAGQTQ